MDTTQLADLIFQKKSMLCVGLDTDPARIPTALQSEADPVFAFNKAIIEATLPYAVAYKPNLAFYEALGSKGWESLQKTMEFIDGRAYTIADAKRGDIGNTANMYAKAFFEDLNFDSVTLSPYMGADTVQPFLHYPGKAVILLALTSNPGSADFQLLPSEGRPLYQQVLEKSQNWGNADQMMYVVGATQAEKMQHIRQIVPHHFLLVPGIGAQGGSLEAVCEHGMNQNGGLLINSSRAILYASDSADFADVAAQKAAAYQQTMANFLP